MEWGKDRRQHSAKIWILPNTSNSGGLGGDVSRAVARYRRSPPPRRGCHRFYLGVWGGAGGGGECSSMDFAGGPGNISSFLTFLLFLGGSERLTNGQTKVEHQGAGGGRHTPPRGGATTNPTHAGGPASQGEGGRGGWPPRARARTRGGSRPTLATPMGGVFVILVVRGEVRATSFDWCPQKVAQHANKKNKKVGRGVGGGAIIQKRDLFNRACCVAGGGGGFGGRLAVRVVPTKGIAPQREEQKKTKGVGFSGKRGGGGFVLLLFVALRNLALPWRLTRTRAG